MGALAERSAAAGRRSRCRHGSLSSPNFPCNTGGSEMLRVSSAMTLLMAMFVVMAAAGCAGTQTSWSGPGIAIPITDLKAIAGKWSGRASRLTSDVDGWLQVTLLDDGTFEAFSAKQIGVFQDKGTFTLSGGKVMAAGSHGRDGRADPLRSPRPTARDRCYRDERCQAFSGPQTGDVGAAAHLTPARRLHSRTYGRSRLTRDENERGPSLRARQRLAIRILGGAGERS